MRSWLYAVVAVALVNAAAAAAGTAVADDAGERLFSSQVSAAGAASKMPEPAAVKPGEVARRLVGLRWPVLRRLCEPVSAPARHTLVLDLIPPVTVVAVARRIERLPHRVDSLLWQGRIIASPPGASDTEGRVNLTAIGICGRSAERPALAGSVEFGKRSYRLQSHPESGAVIIEVDTAGAVSPLSPG